MNRERIETALERGYQRWKLDPMSEGFPVEEWQSREVEAMIREAVDEALEAAARDIESRVGNYTDGFINGMDHAAAVVRSRKGQA